MNLPLYRCDISDNDADEEEVDFIALVDRPAVEKNFLAFNTRQRFAIESEEERIITGLAMIADFPIYRQNEEGEFYVYFDAAAIKKIALRYFRKGYQFNLNLDHNPDAQASGVYVFESWIVDRSKGKVPMKAFEDVADGSWIVSAKVDNEDIWNDIKAGKFNGFSVEGLFRMKRVEQPAPADFDADFISELKKMLQQFKG